MCICRHLQHLILHPPTQNRIIKLAGIPATAPGHQGITGNEIADSYAKEAAKTKAYGAQSKGAVQRIDRLLLTEARNHPTGFKGMDY